MAIRIRKVDKKGHLVALCAAKHKYKKVDLYLNDTIHQALAEKFMADWKGNGIINEKEKP